MWPWIYLNKVRQRDKDLARRSVRDTMLVARKSRCLPSSALFLLSPCEAAHTLPCRVAACPWAFVYGVPDAQASFLTAHPTSKTACLLRTYKMLSILLKHLHPLLHDCSKQQYEVGIVNTPFYRQGN